MNLQDVQTLVDYHYWARDRVLDAVERLTPQQLHADLGNSFPSVRDTLVHLYGAEVVWYGRWQGESSSLPDPTPYPDVASIRGAWVDLERKLRPWVERLGDAGIGRPMEYRGFNGQLQTQPFGHMLQHLVNHGSYHRGQITTMMRQLKLAPPPSTDLIAFYRERAATR